MSVIRKSQYIRIRIYLVVVILTCFYKFLFVIYKVIVILETRNISGHTQTLTIKMMGIFLSVVFLYLWILFLLNTLIFQDVTMFWILGALLLVVSPIALCCWYKRRKPRLSERFLARYPLRSSIGVREPIPKEYLERYIKSLERLLDSEDDIPNATSVSNYDSVHPVSASTEATVYDSLEPDALSTRTTSKSTKPDALSTRSTGKSAKPDASYTRTASDSVKPCDASKKVCNGFVKLGVTCMGTDNFVLMDTTSMTTEEIVSEPNLSPSVHNLMDDLLVSVSENLTKVSCSKIKPTTGQYMNSKLIDEQNASLSSQLTDICNDNDFVLQTTKFDRLQNETKTDEKNFCRKDLDVPESELESSLNSSLFTFSEGSVNFIPLEFIYPCLPYLN